MAGAKFDGDISEFVVRGRVASTYDPVFRIADESFLRSPVRIEENYFDVSSQHDCNITNGDHFMPKRFSAPPARGYPHPDMAIGTDNSASVRDKTLGGGIYARKTVTPNLIGNTARSVALLSALDSRLRATVYTQRRQSQERSPNRLPSLLGCCFEKRL
jgi:hypothetical protein